MINDELVDKVIINSGNSLNGTGYSLDNGVLNLYPNEINIRILIAYCEVEFNGANYKGVVICDGEASVSDASIITNDATDIAITMFAENDDDEIICDVFKNGRAYLIGGSLNDQAVFSDLVVFNNWKKE